MTRSNKTPAEIVAEARANLERAQARAAKEAASLHPAIVALNVALADVNKQIADISRKSTGPNSFENRERAAELHLAFIRSERLYTNAIASFAKDTRASLQTAIEDSAHTIAEGGEVNADMVLMGLPPEPAEIEAYRANMIDAGHEWRSNTPAALRKNAPKNSKVDSEMAAGD